MGHTLKRTLVQVIIIAEPVLSFVVLVKFIWSLSARLSTHSTCLATRSTCFSSRSTRFPLILLICTFVSPLVLLVCPLVVLVVPYFGLFITSILMLFLDKYLK